MIGSKKPKLAGVTVTKSSGAANPFGPVAPAPASVPAKVEAARNAELGALVRRAPKPAPQGPVPVSVPVAGPQESVAGPQESVAGPQESVAGPQESVAGPQESVAGPQESVAVPVTAPVPVAEDHTITRQDFLGKGISKHLQELIIKAPPVEITPDTYMPVSSTAFSDFMIQTFIQYSPQLQQFLAKKRSLLEAGETEEEAEINAQASMKVPKTINKDACKLRDPNKVENFYYQKMVRDYLQRNSPYRGLLVYHGLGSGKTCTSIAAAEALLWGGMKTIYILTPATLSNNYKRELGKCGFFPLRSNNHWSFLSAPAPGIEQFWLENVLGLPKEYIQKVKGGWIPEPDKATNWATLSPEEKASIEAQQSAHLKHRFRFIHYNGVLPEILSQLAADGVAKGKSMFDDSVVIIDEVHNLVRTINGSQIGGKPLSVIINTMEPREPTWSTPLGRERAGFRYPRGYSLYRLLQNAVGAKIIALSATPMINYPHELSILMNIIGGEQRLIEIPLKDVQAGKIQELEAWALQNPTIDYFAVEENERRESILTLTPVPHGFSKVVDEKGMRGFVRGAKGLGPVEESRERKMDVWGVTLMQDLEAKGFLPAGKATEAQAAVAAKAPVTVFTVKTLPLLPEDPKLFVENFIDTNTLDIRNDKVLKARASGLISYYRGGGDDLMPRISRNDVVRVPMHEFMFQGYTKARLKELEMEKPSAPTPGDEPGKAKKGMTLAEMDLYTQATKSQATGFLSLSRAACNWVFPTEVPRPVVDKKKQAKLLGIDQGRIIAANLAVGDDEEIIETEMPEAGEPGEAEGALPDEQVAPPKKDAEVEGLIGGLMSGLEAKAEDYLKNNLGVYSAKYEAMIANIRTTTGPVLVYSNFKTLEGLGIFAAALRAAPEQYVELDIVKIGGIWEIPAALLTPGPKYVLYTGDKDHEKRRLLLQLYNADVKNLPPKLAQQCQQLLADDPDNRNGKVCKIFMITQSGAEGISLFNTRQVHIMEPYWNNVRLQQVIGRAIRLCSHMNLDWDDRTVEIFTYLSVFTEKQKMEAKELAMIDKGMTTDEIILDIATKKQKLADGLFEIAQTSAIDCQLHYHEHGAATQCFKFADAGRPMFMYHPDWRKDVQRAASVRGTK